MLRSYSILIGVCIFFMVLTLDVSAQEFRIESQVYLEDSSSPSATNLTLYSPQLVCDFLMSETRDPIEIVVYDPRQRLVVLLDPLRKVRVELPTLQILKLVEGLKQETRHNERSKFLVEDSFKENTDWADGWVTLTSANMMYRVQGQRPSNPSILPIFFETLDVLTRLKATDPASVPPFPRMRLNQSIRKIGWIPTHVELSAKQNEFFRHAFVARSEHVLTTGFTVGDKALIDSAKKAWSQFSAIELTEYRGLSPKKQIRTSVRALVGTKAGSAEN